MENKALVKKYAHGLVNALKDDEEFEVVSRELYDFFSLFSRYNKLKEILLRPFLPKVRKAQIISMDFIINTLRSQKSILGQSIL